MQLLKGWLVKNGCEEMTTETEIMLGIVMKYKVGVTKCVKTKGAFPIIMTNSNYRITSNLESVFCQLSDFFCDEHGWEVKSSTFSPHGEGFHTGGILMFYMKK